MSFVFKVVDHITLYLMQAKFPFSARSRVVSKAWKSEDISGKWAASSWAKRMQAKNRRSSLNDFDRSERSHTGGEGKG